MNDCVLNDDSPCLTNFATDITRRIVEASQQHRNQRVTSLRLIIL